MPFGHPVNRLFGLQIAATQRIPGNKPNIIFFAIFERRIPLLLAEAVHILHGHHFKLRLSLLDGIDINFRQTDVPDLTLLLHFLQEAEGFVNRHVWIDAVKLVEIDLLDFQTL